MTYPVDNRLFDELAALRPKDVCRRAVCWHDPTGQVYHLSVWGDAYTIAPVERRIECQGREGAPPHPYFSVFLMQYLLRVPEEGPAYAWISEKDIPGGPTFFRGPHAIPTRMLSDRYGNDVDAFGKRCGRLGGRPLPMADAAYWFAVTPKTPVAVLYWQGDEDFPPEAKILFDRSLPLYLAADAIYALAVDVCARI